MKCRFIFFCFFVFLIDIHAQPSQNVEAGKVLVQIKPDAVRNFETRLRTLSRSPTDTSALDIGIRSFDDINRRYGATNMRRVFPHGGEFEDKHRRYGLHLWYEITIPHNEDPEAVAASYGKDENVQISEPSYKKRKMNMLEPTMSVAEAPNDPSFTNRQWNFNNTGQSGGTAGADIRLLEAWEKARTLGIKNNDVIVAVIDDGVNYNHNDLRANMWESDGKHGYNFVKNKGNIVPDSHATHVAGILAAETNNGLGVAGIAGSLDDGWGIKIMTVQILEGKDEVNSIAPAFIYAADNGAVIAQNSWGYQNAGYYNNSDITAINYFINEAGRDEDGNPRPGTPMVGGIVIFAAGNDGRDDRWYPAYFDNVLAVAATNHNGRLANYSNFGNWIDISAPGGEIFGSNRTGGIYSTSYRENNNNYYEYLQGTSMACPHVSGVAALVLSVHGNECFTPEMLRAILLHSATPLSTFDPLNASKMGAGLVNASQALTSYSAPNTVSDLSAQMINAVSCQLNWTIPDNNEEYGFYDIACATEMITEENFDQHVRKMIIITQEPDNIIQTTITDLDPGTEYYIALRSSGNQCQTSLISNVTTVITRDNTSPIVVNALPDITLRDVARETEFDIGDVFFDDDGDVLAYDITVGSDRIAIARISNNSLFIRPVAAGNTLLVLSADDGNTGIIEYTFTLTVTQNLAPVFENLISDVTLIPFSTPFAIDLSEHATDPEDDLIYFQVQPTNRNILIAGVNGNILTLDPQGHGEVAVRVTASDIHSARTVEYINVTVEQKYAPEEIDRLLVYPNPTTDRLWYSFNLTEKSASLSVRIVDSAGKSMFQTSYENLPEGKQYYNINIQTWSSGVYYMQLIKNEKVVDVKRIVKL